MTNQGKVMKEKRGYVYFMSNRKGGVNYIGVTSDLVQRVYQHKEGLADGFTKKYNLKILVYFEYHDSIVEAILAEKKLKNIRREKKVGIIERENPEWKDLYETIV